MFVYSIGTVSFHNNKIPFYVYFGMKNSVFLFSFGRVSSNQLPSGDYTLCHQLASAVTRNEHNYTTSQHIKDLPKDSNPPPSLMISVYSFCPLCSVLRFINTMKIMTNYSIQGTLLSTITSYPSLLAFPQLFRFHFRTRCDVKNFDRTKFTGAHYIVLELRVLGWVREICISWKDYF